MMTQETMSSYEKRVMEAHRLRYMEDLTSEQIAKRLNVKPQTVRTYFSDNDSEKFKRFYSDQERFRLEQSLEQDIHDAEQLADNLLARCIQHDDAGPRTLARASKLALENRKRKVELLQELGIIDKPGDDNDSEGSESTEDLRQELIQGLNEKKKELENSV